MAALVARACTQAGGGNGRSGKSRVGARSGGCRLYAIGAAIEVCAAHLPYSPFQCTAACRSFWVGALDDQVARRLPDAPLTLLLEHIERLAQRDRAHRMPSNRDSCCAIRWIMCHCERSIVRTLRANGFVEIGDQLMQRHLVEARGFQTYAFQVALERFERGPLGGW